MGKRKEDEPCWFDTLPPVPESEKKKIDRLIDHALQSLAEEVAGVKLHRSRKSTQSPSLEELVKDKSKKTSDFIINSDKVYRNLQIL